MRLQRTRHTKYTRWATLLLLLVLGCREKVAEVHLGLPLTASQAHRISFVQWSDPHLFDAGANRHGEGVAEEQVDNWAAFHWAVLETNKLVLEEHRPIDFVVITGDFGLYNIELPALKENLHQPENCTRDPG